jgi:hypothetical protein
MGSPNCSTRIAFIGAHPTTQHREIAIFTEEKYNNFAAAIKVLQTSMKSDLI